MQVCQPLDRVGEGFFVDIGVGFPDSVADSAVVDGRKCQIHGGLPCWSGL